MLYVGLVSFTESIFQQAHTLSTCYMYSFDGGPLKTFKFHQLRGPVFQKPQLFFGLGENQN